MLRSLRTRLVAAYVFAAIVLVLLATVGITAFALSMFGITVRESVDSAARTAPDEVRLELARHHNSLGEAAPDIVRHLVRPGLHVAVVAVDKDGVRRLLAPLVHALALSLFRGHVRGCAEYHANLCRPDRQRGRVLRACRWLLLIRERLRQTKIQQLDHTLRGDHDVCWLQVTMHDAAFVRIFQRCGSPHSFREYSGEP